MANPIEVKVPDIGDFKDVEVIELLVKAGDAIDKEQSLIALESVPAAGFFGRTWDTLRLWLK